ncbi:hypothetical protein ACFX14_003217 [Malus domestica]|uniref:Uncharacterized protein n=1 Tax=Malus domestica TaxID=3750 RepID=A0A498J0L3_MALDO|nr:hypothetical protein DVH24_042246 [Malus domestica]
MPLDGSSEDIPKVYTEVLADEDAGCSSRSGEGITPLEVKMKKAVLEVFEEDGYLCYKDEEVLRIISFQMCVFATSIAPTTSTLLINVAVLWFFALGLIQQYPPNVCVVSSRKLTTSATTTLTVIKTIKSALTTKGISCEDSDFGRCKTFFLTIFASC